MKTKTLFLISCLILLMSPPAYSVDVWQWEADFWDEMRSRDIPWVWALSLHNLSGRPKDKDRSFEIVRIVVDKLLAHPDPGAESLYWAALICVNAKNWKEICRAPELVKRLMEVDADNVYSFAIYYDTELADKAGLHRVSDEQLDWSYLDSWLERAVSLKRTESYDSYHFAEFARILEEYAQAEGVPSYLKGAPLEWEVAFYMFDELVYPSDGGMGRVMWHCHMGQYFGREKIVKACRKLSNKLLDDSKSMKARSDALMMLSDTYSKTDPEYLRPRREAVAWGDPLKHCLNQIWKISDQPWSISYDAYDFVEEYESQGDIAALQSMAESEGWGYQDKAGNKHQCMDALDMDDEGLIQFLGKDPAWMWCGNGELCNLLEPIDD